MTLSEWATLRAEWDKVKRQPQLARDFAERNKIEGDVEEWFAAKRTEAFENAGRE